MDFSHYSDEPVHVAVALTNTLNVRTGEDSFQSAADVDSFIQGELGHWDDVPTGVNERHLHEARALRSRLRAVWDSGSPEDAAASINAILDTVAAQPRVSVHGAAAPHLHFEPDTADPVQWAGAVAAMGLGVALIEGGWERFGTCSSTSCDDVFIDTSKNRSRRHCSETCTTRESVAAYRARQRSGS